jgi:predicted CoA-binding protein
LDNKIDIVFNRCIMAEHRRLFNDKWLTSRTA